MKKLMEPDQGEDMSKGLIRGSVTYQLMIQKIEMGGGK
jgi:hypothetical protein